MIRDDAVVASRRPRTVPGPTRIGDAFTPTTFWVEANYAILDNQVPPDAVCSHVPAKISRAHTDGPAEWVADHGDGFTTMLRGDHTPGETTLHGCLLWDRYRWLDYRTEPIGQLRRP